MAGRIPDEIIQEVLERTNIVELIGSYLPLRQAGGRLDPPLDVGPDSTKVGVAWNASWQLWSESP